MREQDYWFTPSLFILMAFSLVFFVFEAHAQVGTCKPAIGESYLDINNVRARILNNGNLFWRGDPAVYNVPKGGGSNSVFTSGIWVGGYVDKQLRVAAARYENYHFWPGPLDENGAPPANCDDFDRLYKVSVDDIQEYEAGGISTPDLRDWPTGLGAPTFASPDNGIDDDQDGEVDEEGEMIYLLNQPLAQRVDRAINLADGERPAILGDQSIWWVMNDRGNEHQGASSPPIGIEVHVTAFAFRTSGDIGNATFYEYNIYYKGEQPLTDVHVAVFSDADIGNFQDDWVGSDTTLGMGYAWNSDNEDEGSAGYGSPAPALGYDFFQGPIVPSPGDSAKVNRGWVRDFANLNMTSFTYYNNGGGVTEDPSSALDHYNYMRGRWKDGRCITEGGNGRDFSDDCTRFMFSGDPGSNESECEYWSECNSDGGGTNITPADRRFVMGTGPFVMNPGDFQQIAFGVIWAQGADNFDSVQKLKGASVLAQAAYDLDFAIPRPPSAPLVTVTPLDGGAVLEWTNSPQSNNFLETYKISDPFAPVDNNAVIFEGYEVIQYDNALDQVGITVAIYDVINGITRVIDGGQDFVDGLIQDPQTVVANGTDQGVQNYHVITGLTNYATYYFGVRAYAQNHDNPGRKISRGPITRVEVIPTKPVDKIPEATLAAYESKKDYDFRFTSDGHGASSVFADVVNPRAIKEATYTVEFYERIIPGKQPVGSSIQPNSSIQLNVSNQSDAVSEQHKFSGSRTNNTIITYDIKRDGTVLFDGNSINYAAPRRDNVIVFDGLSFTILDVELSYSDFQVTANAAGSIDPPAYAAITCCDFPNPRNAELDGDVQQTNGATWVIHAGGAEKSFESFFAQTTRNQDFLPRIGNRDYEIRFTERCLRQMDGLISIDDCLGYRTDDEQIMEVPFETWDTGVGTPDDTSDDVRMVTIICDTATCNGGSRHGFFDIGGDHVASDGTNDPFSDWIGIYRPDDTTPGQIGRDHFYTRGDPAAAVMRGIVLVGLDIGTAPPYDPALPEPGTVFRIVTSKPIQPGTVFSSSTKGFASSEFSDSEQLVRLEDIGIVPNPYKGASSYEVSQLTDEVRFTNLPDIATIRVFTLNGTLIKTINKQSPGIATIPWNLTTDENLPIASGLYLVNVEVPNVGSHTIKFAVIKKRIQLNVY